MPITQHVSIHPELHYCLWKIEETEEHLLSLLNLNATELADFERTKVAEKRLEWLAARNALKHLVQPYGQFYLNKDEYGKPHLDHSDWHVSMSHAKGYGAASIQKVNPVGIDIELARPQISRIAKKFLHKEEYKWTDQSVNSLTMIWGAKEALYKLHGRTQLIFAEQLLIHPISESRGTIIEEGQLKDYQLHFDIHESLYICLAY